MSIPGRITSGLGKLSVFLALSIVVALAAVAGLVALLVTGGPESGSVDSEQVRTIAGIGLAILIPLVLIAVLLLRLLHKVAKSLMRAFVTLVFISMLVVIVTIAIIVWR